MSNYMVDAERWSKMNIFEQMGNIYSEVGRSFDAVRQGDEEKARQATLRAIDLFDATAKTLKSHDSVRLKEVLRAKEQFLQVVYKDSDNMSEMTSLEKYFRDFAIAARLAKTN